jgi:hypothetical protein
MRSFVFAVMCALTCTLTSCLPYTPSNTADANQLNAGVSVVRPNPNLAKDRRLFVGPGAPFVPSIVHSKDMCEGSAGSALPPLTMSGCVSEHILAPLFAITSLGQSTGTKDLGGKVVRLSNPQDLFVAQSVTESDCWAATLSMARKARGMVAVSKDDIKSIIEQRCPSVQEHKAADTYEIMTAIYLMREKFKDANVGDYLCNTGDCIVNAFISYHAVIMLKANHAVLVSGIQYIMVNGKKQLNGLQILDPMSTDKTPKDLEVLDFCSADAFIIY